MKTFKNGDTVRVLKSQYEHFIGAYGRVIGVDDGGVLVRIFTGGSSLSSCGVIQEVCFNHDSLSKISLDDSTLCVNEIRRAVDEAWAATPVTLVVRGEERHARKVIYDKNSGKLTIFS